MLGIGFGCACSSWLEASARRCEPSLPSPSGLISMLTPQNGQRGCRSGSLEIPVAADRASMLLPDPSSLDSPTWSVACELSDSAALIQKLLGRDLSRRSVRANALAILTGDPEARFAIRALGATLRGEGRGALEP